MDADKKTTPPKQGGAGGKKGGKASPGGGPASGAGGAPGTPGGSAGGSAGGSGGGGRPPRKPAEKTPSKDEAVVKKSTVKVSSIIESTRKDGSKTSYRWAIMLNHNVFKRLEVSFSVAKEFSLFLIRLIQ